MSHVPKHNPLIYDLESILLVISHCFRILESPLEKYKLEKFLKQILINRYHIAFSHKCLFSKIQLFIIYIFLFYIVKNSTLTQLP